MQLTNKTVFVTGGASGIGAACTRALLDKGAKVVVADIEEAKGTEFVQELSKQHGQGKEVIFVRCDVTDAAKFREMVWFVVHKTRKPLPIVRVDAFQQAVTTFKHVDVMLNNAGILGEHNWEKLLDINLKGVIHGTELALTHMRKDKGGQGGVIINMASVVGYESAFFFPVYAASKHGVIGYTRSLADAPDIRDQGVRYACLCPQLTDTALFDDIQQANCRGYYEEILQEISRERIRPEVVAEGLLSLIADDDSNGALLEICPQGLQLVRKKITAEDV